MTHARPDVPHRPGSSPHQRTAGTWRDLEWPQPRTLSPVTGGLPPRWVTAGAIVLVLYLAVVVGYDFAVSMMNGQLPKDIAQTPNVFNYIRELVVFLLAFALVLSTANHRYSVTRRIVISPRVFLLAVFVLIAVVRNFVLGYPVEYIAYGARPILFVLIAASLRHYPADSSSRLLRTVARWAKPFVLVQAGFSTYQVMNAPAFFGATAVGTRPWGTCASPMVLSVTMAVVALLFAVARPRRWRLWFLVCAAVVFVSGGRAGMLAVLIIVTVLLVQRIPAWKLLLIPAVPGVGLLVMLLSSQAISGRQIEGEARFSHWWQIISSVTPYEVIFGTVFGSGTNAAVRASADTGTQEIGSDSQLIALISSLGIIVAVPVVVGGLVHLWRISDPQIRSFLIPVLALCGLVFTVAELSPANIILACVFGLTAARCGCGRPDGERAGRPETHPPRPCAPSEQSS